MSSAFQHRFILTGGPGSGKSTIAKLISTFTWIEKALVRGDYDKKWFERKNKLKNQFMSVPHFSEEYTLDKITPEMKQEMINKIDKFGFVK